MKLKIIVVIGFVFLSGFLIGKRSTSKTSLSQTMTQLRQGQFEFVNPLLECDVDVGLDSELNLNREELTQKVTRLQTAKIQDIAVYFRDLNNGPWFGIREKDKFYPASLVKIPLLLAYLKLAETSPSLLEQKIHYEPSSDLNQAQLFMPEKMIETGKDYTVKELLDFMIKYSDNNAYRLLFYELKNREINEVYQEFGLNPPQSEIEIDTYSPRDYAMFFRILYNSSFLNKDYSNLALKILSETSFTKGLVAGVPEEIKVAHKFGNFNRGQLKQLHDCGIIYFPKRPYILCVMTIGTDIDQQIDAIAQTSRLFYDAVQNFKID